jgi:glycosyltransferase involved in cell wall biosynthesis
LLADEPQPFAQQVLGLLADPERGTSLARSAARFATEYDWSRILPRLESAYARVRHSRLK